MDALFSWYTAGLLGSFPTIILKLSFLSCAGSPVSLIGYPPLFFCYHPYIGKVYLQQLSEKGCMGEKGFFCNFTCIKCLHTIPHPLATHSSILA